MSPSDALPVRGGGAFLLTQLGTQAAHEFAERIAELDLTPPQAGLLRAVALEPGRSQQALAQQLGAPPTRLVALVDGLERRGLLERRRNPDDRRLHAVHLSAAGATFMDDLRRIAGEHENSFLAALTPEEREQLRTLLAQVAADHNLTPGVHPGYQTLRPGDTDTPQRDNHTPS